MTTPIIHFYFPWKRILNAHSHLQLFTTSQKNSTFNNNTNHEIPVTHTVAMWHSTLCCTFWEKFKPERHFCSYLCANSSHHPRPQWAWINNRAMGVWRGMSWLDSTPSQGSWSRALPPSMWGISSHVEAELPVFYFMATASRAVAEKSLAPHSDTPRGYLNVWMDPLSFLLSGLNCSSPGAPMQSLSWHSWHKLLPSHTRGTPRAPSCSEPCSPCCAQSLLSSHASPLNTTVPIKKKTKQEINHGFPL